MTINEQLNAKFNVYTNNVRETDEYKKYWNLIINELTARVSKGNLTAFDVSNVPDSVRDTLNRDLIAQGLTVHEINGHRLSVSIKLLDPK